jgi:hypothetical protein
MKHIVLTAAVTAVLFSSCKKDDTSAYDASVKAGLSVEFDNIAGSADLQLNTTYTNATGESFKVTKLKYYVSNFVLTNVDGTVYTVPQEDSYFLIDESDATTHEPELEIPEGEYKTLTFTLGVDSLRSTKNISERTGVLDPAGAATGMYWDQNNGYIFFNIEGTSPASAAAGNIFSYHIGGYGGQTAPTLNNLRTVTLDLTARGTPKVKAGKETNVHLMIDVLKLFNGSTNISIATHPSVMIEAYSASVANNFAGMIKHDHTEN